jgi:hypothetical protein
MAIDGYEPLLQELESRAGSLAVRAVNADLLQFRSQVAKPVDVIHCMGDRLTQMRIGFLRASWSTQAQQQFKSTMSYMSESLAIGNCDSAVIRSCALRRSG